MSKSQGGLSFYPPPPLFRRSWFFSLMFSSLPISTAFDSFRPVYEEFYVILYFTISNEADSFMKSQHVIFRIFQFLKLLCIFSCSAVSDKNATYLCSKIISTLYSILSFDLRCFGNFIDQCKRYNHCSFCALN